MSEKFELYIKGTIDGTEVLVPFYSVTDADSYLDMLSSSAKRLLLNVNIIAMMRGEQVAELKYTPSIH